MFDFNSVDNENEDSNEVPIIIQIVEEAQDLTPEELKEVLQYIQILRARREIILAYSFSLN